MFGWWAGFTASGIGMVIGICIQYFYATEYLGDLGMTPYQKLNDNSSNNSNNSP
jgi:hypothetical protein